MSPISYFADNKRVSEKHDRRHPRWLDMRVLLGFAFHPSLSREDLCKGFCGCSYRRIGKPFQNRMGLVVATRS
jgi:hypothetical protein